MRPPMGNISLIRGDALALPLADGSVDLICTSPPYFGQRAYRDAGTVYAGQIGGEASPAEFIGALMAATAEMVRIVKPGGSIFINLGDKWADDSKWGGSTGGKHVAALHGKAGPGRGRIKTGVPSKSLVGIPWRYAIRCIDDLGLRLREEIIWHKENAMPESVKDRTTRRHEHLFHFTKAARYFADLDPIRTPHARKDPPRPLGTRNQTQRHLAATDNTGWKDHEVEHHPLGRAPGSVWSIPTQALIVPPEVSHAACCQGSRRADCEDGVGHEAAFPMELPRRIIQAWSPANGVVLDPFMGTGTTLLAAEALGRRGIGTDLSFDYCRLSKWRTTDPGERAKAMQVEKPTQAPERMDSLLDLIAGAS